MTSRSPAIEHLSALIDRIADGDQSAFSEFHALTRNKLRKTALTICTSRSDVEDIVQDAYIKIWRNASSFDPDRASPISWICTIIRNTAIDAARPKRLPIADLDEALSVPAPIEDATDEVDLTALQSLAAEAIGKLPEDRRTLLSLAYLHGESRAALSKRFGVPVGTIKTWLRRTLQAVNRECLPYAEAIAATNATA
ncbi:RNA polymerase sigma factor [Bradyrhizobium sp.]|uniref:RNA polymerase sigma factor n=1 Tax=Bradyrhizobium sp. TaxID=376 RepID=UPI003C4EBCD9